MKKFLIILGAFIVLITSACRKSLSDLHPYQPNISTKSDSLRMYNLLPDSSTYPNNTGYLVYVNDSAVIYKGRGYYSQIGIYGVAPALLIPTQGGTFNIKLVRVYNDSIPTPKNPAPANVLCQTTVTLPANSSYNNLVFYDSAGIPAILYTPLASANPGAPSTGKFKLRVLNFNYTPTPPSFGYYSPVINSLGQDCDVQLQYADSTVIKGDEKIAYGTVGAYQEFTYGMQQFMLYNLTTQSYVNNAGIFNDPYGTFGLFQDITTNNTGQNDYGNWVLPNYGSNGGGYTYPPDVSTVEYGNIASYPFSPGSCYTMLVIGGAYSVCLDQQYGAGVLDNLGKIQVVNANPDQQNVQVSVSAAGQTQSTTNIAFGHADTPTIVPAGPVTITFNYQGQTAYTYSTSIPRLGSFTLYYSADLTNLPFVLAENTASDSIDYVNGGQYSPSLYEENHIAFLNMSPDAGNVFFTYQSAFTGIAEVAVQTPGDELPYKTVSDIDLSNDGSQTPTALYLHLSSHLNDDQASAKVATLNNPFPRVPSPGTYMLTAAGLLNTTDTTKQIRIFLVQQSNFILKNQ